MLPPGAHDQEGVEEPLTLPRGSLGQTRPPLPGLLRAPRAGIQCLPWTVAPRLLQHTRLGQDARTKDHVSPETALERSLRVEGALADQQIGRIEWTILVRFLLESVPEVASPGPALAGSNALQDVRRGHPTSARFTAKCYIMDSLSDPIILGLPELRSLGVFLEPPDDTGRKWIQFTTYGIRLPLLTPSPRGSDMTTQDRKVIVGPDTQEVRVQLKDAADRRAVE